MLYEEPILAGQKVLEMWRKIKPIKIEFLLDLTRRVKPDLDPFDQQKVHFDSWQVIVSKLYLNDIGKTLFLKGMRSVSGEKKARGISRSLIAGEYVAYSVKENDVKIVQLLIEGTDGQESYCLLFGDPSQGSYDGVMFDTEFNEIWRNDDRNLLKDINASDLKA